MKKLLFLFPPKLYKNLEGIDVLSAVLNFPSVTFPQLSASINYPVKIFDGNVERITLGEYKNLISNFDIFAMSITDAVSSLNTELNIKLIKRIKKNAIIILGGHHATLYHKEWLNKGADIVVRGEGENSLPEVLSAIHNKMKLCDIKGITYKLNGEIKVNPNRPFIQNLDSLPYPRWDLLDLRKYSFFAGKDGLSGSIETSRGCSNRCTFCAVNVYWRRTQRFKSVERVIKEMQELFDKGVRRLALVDDNFGANPTRDIAILKQMQKENFNFKWFAFSRADYIKENKEMYRLAAECGLKFTLIGYENPDPKILERFNKNNDKPNLSLSDFQEVYKFLKKLGVMVGGLFIIGYPQEDKDSRKLIHRYAVKISDFPIIQIFRPIRGTPGYLTALKKGLLQTDTFYGNAHIYHLKGDKQLERERLIFRIKFLFNLGNIFQIFSSSLIKRNFYRTSYKIIIRSLLDLNIKRLVDFLYFLIYGNNNPAKYYKIITNRYLSDKNLDKLINKQK